MIQILLKIILEKKSPHIINTQKKKLALVIFTGKRRSIQKKPELSRFGLFLLNI